MKKLITFLLVCSCLLSFSACGNQTEDSSSSVVDEIETTENTSETESDTAETEESAAEETTEEQTDENTGFDKELPANIVLNTASGVMTSAETGKYEAYLDNFTFPEKYIVSAEGDTGFAMAVGTDGTTTFFRFAFPVNDERSGESDFIDYSYYVVGEDAYVIIKAESDSATASKLEEENGIVHCKMESSSEIEEMNDSFSSYDWSKSDIQFVDYAGEQDWNGVIYDTLNCEMTMNEETVPAVFWFTKEGEFAKADFSDETEGSTGYIQAVSEVTLPDMAGAEIREVEAEEIGMSLFSIIMMFAASAMTQADTAVKYPLSEEEIAVYGEPVQETKEVEGYSASGDDVMLIFYPKDEDGNTVYSTDEDGYTICMNYYFNNPKDGKQFMQWEKEKDAFDDICVTIEYVQMNDTDFLITSLIDYEIIEDE